MKTWEEFVNELDPSYLEGKKEMADDCCDDDKKDEKKDGKKPFPFNKKEADDAGDKDENKDEKKNPFLKKKKD